MTVSYKTLGQVLPTAATDTTLYTVPAATAAVASTLSACNQGASTTVRVAVRPAGATLTATHYLVYDALLNAGETMFLTVGLALATTDVVTVRAATANVSFHLYGTELS